MHAYIQLCYGAELKWMVRYSFGHCIVSGTIQKQLLSLQQVANEFMVHPGGNSTCFSKSSMFADTA